MNDRDGRLEITATFLHEDEWEARAGLAGIRMCASSRGVGTERCVDVPLPEQDLVVALNVPPADDWAVRVWAFDRRGEGVWSGRAHMAAYAGESERSRVLLSRCSNLTTVPHREELENSSCKPPRARAFHSMTLLPQGRVLLAGGFSSVRDDVSCDPDCFTPDPEHGFVEELASEDEDEGENGEAEPEKIPCTPTCRVLTADHTAEVYDSIEGCVTRTLELSSARAMHTATVTSDGRHLILAGGVSSARFYLDGEAPLVLPDAFPVRADGKASAEVLHVALLSTTREVGLAGPRFMHAAVDDGGPGVLLIGGMTVREGSVSLIGGEAQVPPGVELASPEGAGSSGLTQLSVRRGHAAARIDDLVVAMGGNDVAAQDPGVFAEVYDLSRRTSEPLGDPSRAGARQRRYAPIWLTLTPLGGGRLLALGGYYDDPFIDPEVRPVPELSPLSSGLFLEMQAFELEAEVVRMLAPRAAHTATLLEDGRVFLAGGLTITENLRVTRSIERFDPDTRESEALLGLDERPLQLGGPRFGHAAVLLRDGSVLRSGGLTTIEPASMDAEEPCAVVACDLEVFNPATCVLSPPVEASLLD